MVGGGGVGRQRSRHMAWGGECTAVRGLEGWPGVAAQQYYGLGSEYIFKVSMLIFSITEISITVAYSMWVH